MCSSSVFMKSSFMLVCSCKCRPFMQSVFMQVCSNASGAPHASVFRCKPLHSCKCVHVNVCSCKCSTMQVWPLASVFMTKVSGHASRGQLAKCGRSQCGHAPCDPSPPSVVNDKCGHASPVHFQVCSCKPVFMQSVQT